MKLEELLQGVEVCGSSGDLSIEINHLAYDSREVSLGGLFFAIPGKQQDGRSFVEHAQRRGAAAVISPGGITPSADSVYVEVTDIRKAMARMACRFYGDPSRELCLIGVTGTNGKTTCTYLLEAIITQAGFLPGVIGTIGYRYRDSIRPPKVTTPESLDLQKLLREMVNHGITHAITEVSSHGIDLQRVYGCHFSCGIFTNLTRDHLDYHETMEQYFATKARLFTELFSTFKDKAPVAILNIEDPNGRRLSELSTIPVRTFHSRGPADYWIKELAATGKGISLTIGTPAGDLALSSPLLTEVNALNILASVATACSLEIPRDAIARGVSQMASVPGRLEKVWEGEGFAVIVDYAHTPDALERVLTSLRSLTSGRLITVFGCGGDRDKGKRPLMGAAAARLSDLVIVTSDNPRSEAPDQIIQEIIQGLQACEIAFRRPGQLLGSSQAKKAYTWDVDRREAIRLAVRIARDGDLVVIAGKGHEQVQIIGGTSYPFKDQEEVLNAVATLGRRGLRMCMN